jgi:squalene cyclase
MATGDIAPVFLGMAGLLPPERLPCPPMTWALSKRVVRWASERVHFGFVMGALELSLIAKRLRGAFGPDGGSRSFLQRRECRRAVELLTLFQNRDGSWNANTVQTAIAVPALVAAGLSPEDERVQRARHWLLGRRVEDPDGVWFNLFSSDVWTTAFNLRALLVAGASPSDPRIVQSIEWLLDQQLTEPQPWPNNRRPNATRTGGWPFQSGNETMADCDDAGVVLTLLALALEPGPHGERIPDRVRARIDESVAKGRAWLEGMQNPDGGWGAFVWAVPGKRPIRPLFSNPVPLPPDEPFTALRAIRARTPELGDPSTEDLTARVLHGLGSHGRVAVDPEVDRAVRFLRRHQTELGAWQGRWVCNYVASTAYVLSALSRVRDDLNEGHVQRALRFLVSRQNADGGFGESTASYRDVSEAGRGQSTVPLTAMVASTLAEIGHGNHPATHRAIEYLLAKQSDDGTWPNDDFVAPNVPPDGFYHYSGVVQHLPLEALARYARRGMVHAVPPAEQHGRWSSRVLDPMRSRTDDAADAVIAELCEAGGLQAVGRLLQAIPRSQEPTPATLPEVARRFFEQTRALPQWADHQKIRRAQTIFADFGVYITFGLFCSSLPQAYAAANGAEVLAQTGEMLGRVRQRIFDTSQFLFDVLDRGSLGPDGIGIHAAQRARLIHAAIRHLLRHHPNFSYDVGVHGEPINQEDMAGTLMTFSVVTFEAAQKLGIALTQEDAEAWIHHWTVVGHLLGVESELLPRSFEDGAHLLEAIRQRQWAPSAAGRKLTAALVQLLQEFFTRDVDLLEGSTPTLVRCLAGDHCADLLGLPPSDWTAALVGAFRQLTDFIDIDDRQTVIERGLGAVALAGMKRFAQAQRSQNGELRVPASLLASLEAKSIQTISGDTART